MPTAGATSHVGRHKDAKSGESACNNLVGVSVRAESVIARAAFRRGPLCARRARRRAHVLLLFHGVVLHRTATAPAF